MNWGATLWAAVPAPSNEECSHGAYIGKLSGDRSGSAQRELESGTSVCHRQSITDEDYRFIVVCVPSYGHYFGHANGRGDYTPWGDYAGCGGYNPNDPP